MLNEYVYCPRLFHLMHVEGLWAGNVFTAEGTDVHRRVDRFDEVLPEPSAPPAPTSTTEADGEPPPEIHRSVTLSSLRLGIVAKLDLVFTADDEAVPVDTKRGRPPDNPERCWEPERIQLMAQGLLLREQGYRCDHGVIYYAGSRTRVDVPFTPDLEARALRYIEEARHASQRSDLPDPLEDSPKCNHCSLNSICLPDETLALRDVPPEDGATSVRRLYPARAEAVPLYVQEQGTVVTKDGERLVIRKHGEPLGHVRLKGLDHLVVCGGVMVTAHALHILCEAGIPVVHLSRGHWFYGMTNGFGLRNAFDRAAQFRIANRPDAVMRFARAVVEAKISNQKTMLLRNARPQPQAAARRMAELIRRIPDVHDLDELLGIEGAAGAAYFGSFASAIRPRDFEARFDFATRNRRPPQDPVNALLSFGNAMLAKECTVAVTAAGLDPWWGLFHQPRHGRPAMALDLMEEFRPVIVDSAVITAINTGMVGANDFLRTGRSCVLNASGRKAMIRAFEARLDQLVTHPSFQYRCSWRCVIRLQARLIARWLRGDIPVYTGMTTR